MSKKVFFNLKLPKPLIPNLETSRNYWIHKFNFFDDSSRINMECHLRAIPAYPRFAIFRKIERGLFSYSVI